MQRGSETNGNDGFTSSQQGRGYTYRGRQYNAELFVVARNQMNILTIITQLTGKLAFGQRPADDGGAETRTVDPCSVTVRRMAEPMRFRCLPAPSARTRTHRAYYTTHPRCPIRRFPPFFPFAATPETALNFGPNRVLVTDTCRTVKTFFFAKRTVKTLSVIIRRRKDQSQILCSRKPPFLSLLKNDQLRTF
jgi:hypothetical protein